MKVKMKTVANTFLTHRAMGECEAVYKLIPNMNMSKSNIGTVWLTTGKNEGRNKRMKMKKPEEYKDDREYVEIEGRDGEWYEQRDLISQYERRPKLDMTCLVQFHRLYRSEALKRMEGGEESEVDKNRAKNTNDKYRVYYSEVGCGIEDCVKCQGKKKGEGLPLSLIHI